MSALVVIALSFADVENWALTWLPILFMGLIVLLIGVTLRHMPRTKPQEIKPQSSDSISWDDVAGVNEAKAELREVVDFLRDSKRFKRLGAKVPKGILLHGPPGTGKTLLAKAVAHESNAKFFAQSASSFVEMDGFASADNIVVIAASNMLDKLDPALLRPGRFDRQVFVSPPDLTGRDEILRVHSANKPLAGVDLELVARQTSGLSGADLANICNEAGHALCSELLPGVERVHKISIVPRGRALGYTLNLPEEDRYLKDKEELIEHMTVLLAGRVAEHVVFGGSPPAPPTISSASTS
ncbi:MAG: AAA family ATPase [Thermoleophilaceae bacterium]